MKKKYPDIPFCQLLNVKNTNLEFILIISRNFLSQHSYKTKCIMKYNVQYMKYNMQYIIKEKKI